MIFFYFLYPSCISSDHLFLFVDYHNRHELSARHTQQVLLVNRPNKSEKDYRNLRMNEKLRECSFFLENAFLPNDKLGRGRVRVARQAPCRLTNSEVSSSCSNNKGSIS